MNENKKITKKQIIKMSIGVGILIVLAIGATYAYFVFGNSNMFGTSKLTANTPNAETGSVVLENINEMLSLELSADDMTQAKGGRTYWASNEGKKTEETINQIGKIKAMMEGTYTCSYTLTIEEKSENNLYNAFQSFSQKTNNQILLKVNEKEYDYNTENLFPITYKKVEEGITQGNDKYIETSMYIKNELEIDQTELNNKEVELEYKVTEFNCKNGEELPKITGLTVGEEEGIIYENNPTVKIEWDNENIDSYCITETNDSSSCEWENTTSGEGEEVEYETTLSVGDTLTLYAFIKDGEGFISESVSKEITMAQGIYNLTITKGTGINQICYRINGSNTYMCDTPTGNSITKEVNYNSEYSYYGIPSEGYTMSRCTSSSDACGGTMPKGDKTESISATINKYQVIITKTNEVEKIHYKENGVWKETTEDTITIEVEHNSSYEIYGEAKEGYKLLECTSSSDTCSGVVTSGKTLPLVGVVNQYNLTITKGEGVNKIYYEYMNEGAKQTGNTTEGSIVLEVDYNSTYKYYGEASTGYTMSSCTSSSNACSGTMPSSNTTKSLTATLNQYTLTIPYSAGVKEIKYKINGATSWSTQTINATADGNITLQVNYGSTYEYYGTKMSDFVTLNNCYDDNTHKCSGTMPNSNTTATKINTTTNTTIANYVKSLSNSTGSNGVITQTGLPTTVQTGSNATTDYRYIGADPNNYVCLGNLNADGSCIDEEHLYRIIGVMPTQTTKTGSYENRIKLIKSTAYIDNDISTDGTYYWTGLRTSGYSNYTSYTGAESNMNNWEESTLNRVVLNQTYYNSLEEKYQNMIGNSVWYLGGNNTSEILVSTMYTSERSETVYSYEGKTNPKYAERKIGLMYASDYGYATSGGSTTDKNKCLTIRLSSWDISGYSDCKDNDWLLMSSNQWTITPRSDYSYSAFLVSSNGKVYGTSVSDNQFVVRPVFSLTSGTRILSGTGTINSPYTLD